MAAAVRRTLLSDTTLAFAVAGSLLLHLLLLLLPVLREAREEHDARQRIVARLLEPAEPRKPAWDRVQTDPAAGPGAPAATPDRRQASRPQSSPRAAADSRLAEKPTARRAVAAPAPERAAPASTMRAPAAGAEVAAPAPGPPDAGTLAQYRLAVLGAARRYKRYPELALESRWQGRVEVRMTVGADGSISSLAVRSSTGHALLDERAIDMIRRAQASAPLPPALLGKQFVVDVPVEFALGEPEA